jgi:hypothetical protein
VRGAGAGCVGRGTKASTRRPRNKLRAARPIRRTKSPRSTQRCERPSATRLRAGMEDSGWPFAPIPSSAREWPPGLAPGSSPLPFPSLGGKEPAGGPGTAPPARLVSQRPATHPPQRTQRTQAPPASQWPTLLTQLPGTLRPGAPGSQLLASGRPSRGGATQAPARGPQPRTQAPNGPTQMPAGGPDGLLGHLIAVGALEAFLQPIEDVTEDLDTIPEELLGRLVLPSDRPVPLPVRLASYTCEGC